jgi:glutamyl-tRNA synthetase
MDASERVGMSELILKHALKNAVEHEGVAHISAVVNKVVGEQPKLRQQMDKLVAETQEIIDSVNKMKPDEQRRRLLELWPNALEKKPEPPKKLPPLQNVGETVVLRFAPNPNGPPTMGAARVAILNDEYAKMYKGQLVLRFDDTDPRTKKPLRDAYDWYIEDFKWLGIKPDRTIYMSQRLPLYYEHAEKLIGLGNMYACSCPQEKFKKLRDKGEECNHRHEEVREIINIWTKMKAGDFKEGEMVMRVKTNMKHPNPAIRDWVAFRILEAEHPLVENKYHAWPMLDFASAVEDHLSGITHIIRGKELRHSTERQKYLYNYFGWTYPETKYVGRVAIHEFGKLSTSAMARDIAAGKYSGWDDPQLPTIRALRKRGFTAEAIREFWLSFGLTERDVSASMEILEAINRKTKAKL